MRRYKKKDRTKINQLILGIFLVFLMVFSIVGSVLVYRAPNNNNQEFVFNNIKYQYDMVNNVYFTEFNDEYLVFFSDPATAVPIPETAINDLLNARTPGPIITFDPYAVDDLPLIDYFRLELDEFFLSRDIFLSHGVYTEPIAPYNNFPVLDCVNATKESPVIKFINSSTKEFSYDNYCLQIKGSGRSLIESRDSLFYSLYGLI